METTPPFTGLGYTCRVEHPGLIVLAAVGEAPKRAAALALGVAVEAWLDSAAEDRSPPGEPQPRTAREVWRVDRSGAIGVRTEHGVEAVEVLVWCDPAFTDRLRVALAKAGLAQAATAAYKAALAEVAK